MDLVGVRLPHDRKVLDWIQATAYSFFMKAILCQKEWQVSLGCADWLISLLNKLKKQSSESLRHFKMFITMFFQSLKHLDLSHNQIESWLNENSSCNDQVCYAASDPSFEPVLPILAENRKISSRLGRLTSRSGCCVHKKHVRLDGLRTLILSDNKLDKIQVRKFISNVCATVTVARSIERP